MEPSHMKALPIEMSTIISLVEIDLHAQMVAEKMCELQRI